MAALVLINPVVTIAGVNMSQYIKEVAMELEADNVERTTFGSGGWRESIPGLKKGEVKVTFNDDFAATTVDDRLWAWFGTTVTFAAKAVTGTTSATNPEYQGNVVVTQFSPLAGKVGELAEQSVTWPATGAITRAVS